MEDVVSGLFCPLRFVADVLTLQSHFRKVSDSRHILTLSSNN